MKLLMILVLIFSGNIFAEQWRVTRDSFAVRLQTNDEYGDVYVYALFSRHNQNIYMEYRDLNNLVECINFPHEELPEYLEAIAKHNPTISSAIICEIDFLLSVDTEYKSLLDAAIISKMTCLWEHQRHLIEISSVVAATEFSPGSWETPQAASGAPGQQFVPKVSSIVPEQSLKDESKYLEKAVCLRHPDRRTLTGNRSVRKRSTLKRLLEEGWVIFEGPLRHGR